jgi:hypothetical protein
VLVAVVVDVAFWRLAQRFWIHSLRRYLLRASRFLLFLIFLAVFLIPLIASFLKGQHHETFDVRFLWNIFLRAPALNMHCAKNLKQIFPEMKLRGLVPNLYIHVCICVRDLYIPMIGPQVQYSEIGGPIVGIYKSLTDAWMEKLGTRLRSFISGNFRYSVAIYQESHFTFFGKNSQRFSQVKMSADVNNSGGTGGKCLNRMFFHSLFRHYWVAFYTWIDFLLS